MAKESRHGTVEMPAGLEETHGSLLFCGLQRIAADLPQWHANSINSLGISQSCHGIVSFYRLFCYPNATLLIPVNRNFR